MEAEEEKGKVLKKLVQAALSRGLQKQDIDMANSHGPNDKSKEDFIIAGR